jgi:hypothetical protein
MYKCGIDVSLEVGRMFCNSGTIDLYIPEREWAVELLVDGIGMREHHDRFKKGKIKTYIFFDKYNYNHQIFIIIEGKYSTIPIKDYLIIDIRHTVMVQKYYSNTWHVVPNEDFTNLAVFTDTEKFNIQINGATNDKDHHQDIKYLEYLKKNQNIDNKLMVIMVLLSFIMIMLMAIIIPPDYKNYCG